jgi:hypothetical protein
MTTESKNYVYRAVSPGVERIIAEFPPGYEGFKKAVAWCRKNRLDPCAHTVSGYPTRASATVENPPVACWPESPGRDDAEQDAGDKP